MRQAASCDFEHGPDIYGLPESYDRATFEGIKLINSVRWQFRRGGTGSGTAGFLIAAGEYLREHHPRIFTKDALRHHFNETLFNGFDFDSTMLRIGSMNMLLHGVENLNIRYKDSLSEEHAGKEERYTLALANPPFAGSLDYENTAKDLLRTDCGGARANGGVDGQAPRRLSAARLSQAIHLSRPLR